MNLVRMASRYSALALALSLVGAGACSSSSSNNDAATGGSGGSTGGSSGGTGGAGGRAGSGGSAGGTGGATGGSGGATGGSGGTVTDGGTADGGAALALTSPGFTEGQTIPALNTCAGANTSPELNWTAGPTGTLSYAVLLTDLDTGGGPVIHWVIWDVPITPPLRLGAGLANTPTLITPPGAKQAHHIPFFQNNDNGYRGPCPSGNLHHYQFEVHAIDIATLPGVTTTSTPPQVRTAILAHSLAHGDLNGMSTASAAGQ